jgi:glycosyltransferase involved in cell wall biosynthesis
MAVAVPKSKRIRQSKLTRICMTKHVRESFIKGESVMEKVLPKVSIIIPVYNGANYMREAINSALAQTYPNIEVIVVNDGSRDGGATERIALSYGNRIRYFHKENGGVATALNMGIENMQGEYFSWLSHDDMYTPDKIEKQVNAILAHGEPAIAYCDFCTISSSGKFIENFKVSPKSKHSMRCLLAIGTETALHGCALLIPRIFFDRYGYFNPSLKITQDYDMWFRLSKYEKFVYVGETLVLSRQHEEQDSKTKPIQCTIEADCQHSRLISELSADEVDIYCNKSVDYLINAFNLYKNAGYEKTAFRLLKHICRLAIALSEEEKAISIVNEMILMSVDRKIATQIWKKQLLPIIFSQKEKPRILVYSNVWFRGGIERVLSIILNKLKNKYSWVLVSTDREMEGGFYLDDKITHIKISDVSPEKIASRIAALSVLLDVDLFIGNPNIMFDFLKVYELLHNLNIKSIACNHGHYFLPYHYRWLNPIIEQRLEAYKHANVVTWLTSFGANIFAQFGENVALMPNPNTFELSKTITISSKIKKVLLCVGRFYDAVKRLDRVLEVFNRVLVHHPDAELVLVGGYDLDMHIPADSKESIRDMMQRLSIPDKNVRFVGECDNVEKYYENASLLIMTSDSEGFSIVLNEAGAFGLPCVLFEIPGLEDIILNGENGFIVPQDDLDGMASKVSLLLTDQELRCKMGNRARELVERFSQQRICARWENLIDTVLATNDQVTLNQKLSKHFMEPIQDLKDFTRRLAREYEKNIALMLSRTSEPVVQTIVKVENAVTSPCTHCNELQNSLSWRITKPLRWSKRLYISLKENGLKVTTIKVINKINNKLGALKH